MVLRRNNHIDVHDEDAVALPFCDLVVKVNENISGKTTVSQLFRLLSVVSDGDLARNAAFRNRKQPLVKRSDDKIPQNYNRPARVPRHDKYANFNEDYQGQDFTTFANHYRMQIKIAERAIICFMHREL